MSVFVVFGRRSATLLTYINVSSVFLMEQRVLAGSSLRYAVENT